MLNWRASLICSSLHLLILDDRSFDSLQDGSTALQIASETGHCEVVRLLLEAKADVNMKDKVSGCSVYLARQCKCV